MFPWDMGCRIGIPMGYPMSSLGTAAMGEFIAMPQCMEALHYGSWLIPWDPGLGSHGMSHESTHGEAHQVDGPPHELLG